MSKRILVVEDEEDNRRIMRDLLTSVGYEIIDAVTGPEGVTAAMSVRICSDVLNAVLWFAAETAVVAGATTKV